MTDVSIRIAEESDLPGVMSLLRACIDDMRARGIDQWDEIYPTQERFAADVSDRALYVGSTDGVQLVGAFTLNGYQDAEYAAASWTFNDARVSVVHRLIVHPAFHGRGIARELMRFAEDLATSLGCGIMRLDAFRSNPKALRLYRALGYLEAGEVRFRKGAFVCFVNAG